MRWSLCYLQAMVSIKETIQGAMAFAKDSLGAERTADLQLEGIQSGVVEGKDVWLITLSMENPSPGLVFGPMPAYTRFSPL